MPAIDYRNSRGEKLSGVTTIIDQNLGWSKGGLIGWAYNRGKEGKSLRDTDALDIGTIAHKMIEADLRNKEFKMPDTSKEIIDKIENCFLAWIEWKDTVGIQMIESEKSLISEKYGFGGTIDVADVKKVISILDLKTSEAIYPEHRIQISAYGNLWNENFPDKRIQAYYILKLGKNDGSFSYNYWPELNQEWEVFLCLLKLHQLKKEIK